RAVLAQVTPLIPEGGRLAPRKARRVKLQEGFQVVRVDDVPESLLEQFLAGVSDDSAIRPVDAEETAGGVVVGDAGGGVLERTAEPLFALTQRCLGLPEVGDVGASPEPRDDSARAVADGGAASLEPAIHTVRTADAIFHVIRAAPRHRIS